MAEIFFRQINKNNKSEDYSFYKLNDKGEILAVSTSKRTISRPETLMLYEGFEIITEKEFEKEFNKIVK